MLSFRRRIVSAGLLLMVIDWIFENCYKQRNRVLTFAISIHAPRTGSDGSHRRAKFTAAISIHAPRTGSDSQAGDGARLLRRISIHAPRTGSDTPSAAGSSGLEYFNPRSPHGERRKVSNQDGLSFDFNPRSPHGERHCAPFMDMGKSVISIHAPRTGSDADLDGHLPSGGDFNPRSPHGERRSQRLWKEYTTCNFNPRSPHGERHGGEWCA